MWNSSYPSYLQGEQPEHALHALPKIRLRRIERRALGLFQVKLEEHADAVSAPAVGPHRVDAVGVAAHDFPGRGFVEEARADSAVPVARLLQAGQVINAGGGRRKADIPAFFLVEWRDVIATEQDEFPRADFLVIVAGQ